MTILRDPLRLKLAIAFVPILLALSNIGVVERVFAHGKLVVAIQPSVSSDEMLKKAQPLEKFLRDGLGGKTDVQIYVPSSFAAVLESLPLVTLKSLSCRLGRPSSPFNWPALKSLLRKSAR